MSQDIEIFVLHHKLVPERKESLLRDFASVKPVYKINWIENFLPEEIKNIPCKINTNELSITLKHQEILKQLVNSSDLNYAIVLEDDIDLYSVTNLNQFLNVCLTDIKTHNGDILWIGSVKKWNIYHIPKTDTKSISYFSEDCLSRCAHAYIISKNAASKVLESYHYNIPADHLYNEIIQKLRLKSGWTDPFLTQKTLDGNWKSIRD